MAQDTCTKCGGSGWVVERRGELSGATRCGDCQAATAAERTAALLAKANIPPNYRKVDFDNFRIPNDNPIARTLLSQAMVIIRSYAREYPVSSKPGILLVGPTGVGKTHLAIAALKAIIARGIQGTFFNYQSLLDKIIASYNPAAGAGRRNAYESAMESDVLLLDDIGANRAIDWVEDAVNSIITYRCNHIKPLIATTNLYDPEFGPAVHKIDAAGFAGKQATLAERIGERSRSRLFEMCRVVKMPQVEDYRPHVVDRWG